MIEGLASGVHWFPVADPIHRYLVAGSGPVCIVNPDHSHTGPEYRRMPALEDCLTMAYLAPVAGLSDADRLDSGVEAQVRLLRAVVSHLGVRLPLIFGDGNGCTAAGQFALRHPELLAGLILYRAALDRPEDAYPAHLRALAAAVPLLIIDQPSGFVGRDVA